MSSSFSRATSELASAIDLIEKSWPKKPASGLKEAMAKIRNAVAESVLFPSPLSHPQTSRGGPGYFDSLDLVRRVLMTNDLLFLSRQVTYHIAASGDLPPAFADRDQVHTLVSKLVEHIVKRANRNSRVSIGIRGSELRDGAGIEISFSGHDAHIDEEDQQGLLAHVFEGAPDRISGVSLQDCRQAAVRQMGQLWIDFANPSRPLYRIALPSSERTGPAEPSSHQTFKYDISVSNYSDVRKRFGIRKSRSLLTQIEHSVRALVRYPIDMVMSLGDRGMVTAIYETQRGAAQSVAGRISQRLGAEHFTIGKKPVEVTFSYHLSPLSPPVAGEAGRHPRGER